MTRRRAPGGGRKPLPVAVHVLRGNAGKRDRTAALRLEANAERGIPLPPPKCSAETLAVWNQLGADIEAMGLLSKCDTCAFEQLVEVYVRWRRCTVKVLELGDVVPDKDGQPMTNPWATRAEKAWTQLRTMSTEFGLTPSSRVKVAPGAGGASGAAPPVDATARFFGG